MIEDINEQGIQATKETLEKRQKDPLQDITEGPLEDVVMMIRSVRNYYASMVGMARTNLDSFDLPFGSRNESDDKDPPRYFDRYNEWCKVMRKKGLPLDKVISLCVGDPADVSPDVILKSLRLF